MCKNCGKNNCCCVKTVSVTGPRGKKGDKGATGATGLPGAAGLNGTSTVLFATSGVLVSPNDLSAGAAMCLVTITDPGDYVFDFTVNAQCKSAAVDTFYLRTFARKNGVNLAAPVADYIKTTILPKQSTLGTLSSVTHNHNIQLTGLIAGDTVAFWGLGDAEELSSSMTYIKK